MKESKMKHDIQDSLGIGALTIEEALKRIRETFPNPEVIEQAINSQRQRKKKRLEEFVRKLNENVQLSRRFALRPAETLRAVGLLGNYDSLRIEYGYGAFQEAEARTRLDDLHLDPDLVGGLEPVEPEPLECGWISSMLCDYVWWPFDQSIELQPLRRFPEIIAPIVLCALVFHYVCALPKR